MIPLQPEEIPFVGLIAVGAMLAIAVTAMFLLFGSFSQHDHGTTRYPSEQK